MGPTIALIPCVCGVCQCVVCVCGGGGWGGWRSALTVSGSHYSLDSLCVGEWVCLRVGVRVCVFEGGCVWSGWEGSGWRSARR